MNPMIGVWLYGALYLVAVMVRASQIDNSNAFFFALAATGVTYLNYVGLARQATGDSSPLTHWVIMGTFVLSIVFGILSGVSLFAGRV